MKISNLVLALGIMTLLACAASKPVTLAINMAKGNEFSIETSTNTVVDVNVMGQAQKSLSTQTVGTKYQIMDVMPNGNVALKGTIMSMASSTDNAQASMSYDSKKPNDGDASLASLMTPILGHEMNIVMDQQGEIVTFEQEDVLEKMFANADESMMAAKATMEGQYGEDGMRNIVQAFGSVLPNKPIKKGDTWTKSSTTKNAMTLMTNYTYTLNERKEGKAYLSVVGTTKSDPTAAPADMMGMEIRYDMSGPVKGTLVVDEKTGWTIESDIEQTMKGTMKIKNEMIGEIDAQMDMVATTTTKATGL